MNQVTSTLPPTASLGHYLPIHPTKKFRKGGVQLKLCDSFGVQTELSSRSYVRIDGIEEVPLEILSEATRSDGLSLMLKEKSFATLQHILRMQT